MRHSVASKGEQGALPAPIVQREILRGYVGTWMTGRGAINWRNVRRQKNSRIQLVSVFLCRGTDAVSSVPTAAFGAHYSVTRSRLTVCDAALRGPRQKLFAGPSMLFLPSPPFDFASSSRFVRISTGPYSQNFDPSLEILNRHEIPYKFFKFPAKFR